MSAAAAAVIALAMIVYSFQHPKYAATARVAVERQQSGELVAMDKNQPNLTADSGTVDTEVQVILSPAVAEAVVEQLKLAEKPGFGFPQGGVTTDQLAARVRAAETVRNGLDVQREGLSYAIAVKFTGLDPVMAASVVNATVDAYINGRRFARSRRREREIQQLGDRLGQLRNDVMQAESAVARYRAQTNLADLQTSSPSALAGLSALNAQLASAKAEEAAAQVHARSAQSGAASLESPVLRELRTQQARLNTQLTDLKGRYGPEHPARNAVERQLVEVNALVKKEFALVQASSNAEANAAEQASAAIQGSIAQTQGRLIAGNNASVRLNELERNAESTRALYQSFLDRYRENLAAQGTERSNAYILGLATPPRQPVSPNFKLFLGAGILLGLVAAVAIAVLLEFMEQGICTRKDIEDHLHTQALGSIPDLRSIKEARAFAGSPREISDYVLQNDGSLVAEAFRSVRAALRIGREGQIAKSIAVSSSLPGEGKTTAVLSLARAVARTGLKVIVVDGDVRRRSASRNLVGKVEVGVTDVLLGNATLDQALLQDPESKLYMLLQRAASPQEYDLIPTREMKELIDKLATQFDLVIIDTAPILPVADARAVAAMADATLLIVHWRKTPIQVVSRALHELNQAGATVAGTLLSQVDIRWKSMVGNDVHYYRAYTAFAE
jgi:polysaccharide biosynthesis transport protein